MTQTPFILDKHSRPILPGDTIKVFHFKARGRNYYMHKWVKEVVKLGTPPDQADFLKVHHIGETIDKFYHIQMDGRKLDNVEIVQGYGTSGGTEMFCDRKKMTPTKP